MLVYRIIYMQMGKIAKVKKKLLPQGNLKPSTQWAAAVRLPSTIADWKLGISGKSK